MAKLLLDTVIMHGFRFYSFNTINNTNTGITLITIRIQVAHNFNNNNNNTNNNTNTSVLFYRWCSVLYQRHSITAF
jgi:hypothetical protein